MCGSVSPFGEASVNQVSAALSRSTICQQWFEEVRSMIEQRGKQADKYMKMAASFELCTQTWKQTDEVRVHAHAGFIPSTKYIPQFEPELE